MKLNFTIDIVESADYLEDEIIDRASSIFIENVLGNKYYDENTLYEKLENAVIKKLETIMNTDFKNSVSTKVTENLANKFEKTKQYKLLVENKEVISENVIKSGLKDLVSEIVRSEMKKVFQ